MSVVRDLASGKRRIIKNKDVQIYSVPFYEGLTLETMLQFAAEYPQVGQALPIAPKEVLKLPRAYIVNVIYTLVGQPFAAWVSAGIEAINRKVQLKNNMMVEMDPEIARIFKASTSVSGKLSFILIILLSFLQWEMAPPIT